MNIIVEYIAAYQSVAKYIFGMKDYLEVFLTDNKILSIPISYTLVSTIESIKKDINLKEMYVRIEYNDNEYNLAQNILMGLQAFRLPLINLPTLIIPIQYYQID